MRSALFQWSTACCLFTVGASACATENGLNHFPAGVNTIMNALLPPPGGTSLQSYSLYYTSDRVNGADGQSLDPNFKTRLSVEALRVLHTWEPKLGPFYLASAVMVPFSHIDIRAGGMRDSSTGMGDPVISPLYMGYINSDATLHTLWGLDFYAPIGKYDKNRLANHGLNYWTFGPFAHVTWLPSARWEVSGTVYGAFNTRNRDTNYRSGHSLSLEGTVGYHPVESLPDLKVAVQGFAYTQLVDDKLDGRDLPGSRGRAFALGPQISYNIGKRGGGIVLKWQKEFGVKNRSQGNLFWFQFGIPF